MMQNLTPAEIANFYDTFGKRGLDDYVQGNRRIEHAIARVSRHITPQTKSWLDVGCGIGIACSVVGRRYPQLRVNGIDISPENVAAATSLFANDRLSFQVSKVTDDAITGTYDVISMLDVYEHIPRDIRRTFHTHLQKLLASDGTVVITVPSPLHQAHLREHNPAELQIVDEVVTLDDAMEFARALDAEVILFEYMGIWRSNDYLHFVMQRNPTLAHLNRSKPGPFLRVFRKAAEHIRSRSRRRHIEQVLRG